MGKLFLSLLNIKLKVTVLRFNFYFTIKICHIEIQKFMIAATTNYHKLGGLNNKNFISHSYGS